MHTVQAKINHSLESDTCCRAYPVLHNHSPKTPENNVALVYGFKCCDHCEQAVGHKFVSNVRKSST